MLNRHIQSHKEKATPTDVKFKDELVVSIGFIGI